MWMVPLGHVQLQLKCLLCICPGGYSLQLISKSGVGKNYGLWKTSILVRDGAGHIEKVARSCVWFLPVYARVIVYNS